MADAADHEKSGQGRGGFDLDRLTVQELTALRDKVEGKRREKLEAAKDAVLSETRAKLAELGLTLEAAMPLPAGAGRGRKSSGKVLAKFRGPKGEEWSGRGRLPKWVEDHEKQGRKRDEFLIQKELAQKE